MPVPAADVGSLLVMCVPEAAASLPQQHLSPAAAVWQAGSSQDVALASSLSLPSDCAVPVTSGSSVAHCRNESMFTNNHWRVHKQIRTLTALMFQRLFSK